MMDNETIVLHPLQKIEPARLKQLSQLHQQVLPTLLSQLGLPFVERYYQAALRDPQVIGFYAVSKQSGEPCGFAIGTPQPDTLNAQLRQPLSWLLIHMLPLLLRHPRLLWQTLASAQSTAEKMPQDDETIELTYLGVAAQLRGYGLGSQLLQAFLDASRRNGYRRVVLSVESNNAAAIRFYQRAGFVIHQTFRVGDYERHRMEIVL